jgi:hypothetical protein
LEPAPARAATRGASARDVHEAADAAETAAVDVTAAAARSDIGLRRTVLPNGLTVLTDTMPWVRSVALGAWVRAASVHEPREKMGISHLLEHMVFKGTDTRSAREIALALEVLGGSLDAYTSREHTSFQARVLDEHVTEAADILADIVFNPVLRQRDLELERKVVLEEISMVEDTPDDQVFELHNAALWGAHPYGYSILGTRESVVALDTEDLRVLHALAYRPSQIVIAASGNIEHDQVQAGQAAGGKGAGVDADPIGPDVRVVGDGVPMHHDPAMRLAEVEEVVADIEDVLRSLPVDRDARTDAGMHEEIIPLDMMEREAAQPAQMPGRQEPGQLGAQMGESLHAFRRTRLGVDAVAVEGGRPAVIEPRRPDRGILQEVEHRLLVIAEQVHLLESGERLVKQEVDDLPRFQPAIDVIAEIDHDPLPVPVRRGVGQDHGLQLPQQVAASMDVANDIDPPPGRGLRRHRPRPPLGFEKPQHHSVGDPAVLLIQLYPINAAVRIRKRGDSEWD